MLSLKKTIKNFIRKNDIKTLDKMLKKYEPNKKEKKTIFIDESKEMSNYTIEDFLNNLVD